MPASFSKPKAGTIGLYKMEVQYLVKEVQQTLLDVDPLTSFSLCAQSRLDPPLSLSFSSSVSQMTAQSRSCHK